MKNKETFVIVGAAIVVVLILVFWNKLKPKTATTTAAGIQPIQQMNADITSELTAESAANYAAFLQNGGIS